MFRRIFEIVVAISLLTVAIAAIDYVGRSEDVLAGKEGRWMIAYDSAPPLTSYEVHRFSKHLDKLYGKHKW